MKRAMTKLPNSEQSYKGKVKTHKYVNRQNQSTTGNCENRNDSDLAQAFLKKWWVESDFKAPNLPLSLRFKVSGCHYNSIYSKVKVLWSEKIGNFKVMLKSTSNIKVSLSEGWALKITKPQKRFSVRVKEFLHSIYAHCNSTGKRSNFDMVVADLKTLKKCRWDKEIQ